MMVKVLQILLAVLLVAAGVAGSGPPLPAVALFALGPLLFPGLLLVVFGILFGLLGADFDLPSLFWHDRLRTRMGAATAVTLLLALAGVLAFLAAGPLDG